MADCIFCRIIKGEIPCDKVYEDKDVIAFLDIKQVNKGHTLVVPKEHVENIFDISPDRLAKTMNIIQKVAVALNKMSHGVNVVINNNSAAGQVVFHFHAHVVPRFKDDGFKHWVGKKCPEEEAKIVAEEIRQLLSI